MSLAGCPSIWVLCVVILVLVVELVDPRILAAVATSLVQLPLGTLQLVPPAWQLCRCFQMGGALRTWLKAARGMSGSPAQFHQYHQRLHLLITYSFADRTFTCTVTKRTKVGAEYLICLGGLLHL